MVFQVAFYRFLIGTLRLIRAIIAPVMLLQRLPIFIIGFCLIILTRLSSKAYSWHRFFLVQLRFVFRLGFFLRGIRLQIKTKLPLRSLSGIHICNDFHLSYWLLFAYLPHDHLVISNDRFFATEWLRPLQFLFGFYPQEYGLTPDNYTVFDSRLDPYLNQGYSFWQPVYFQYRDTDALPYGVIMAMKHGLPIHVWQFESIDQLDFVHWLRRRVIRLELVNEIEISRRMALTLAAYSQTILKHFGKTLVDQQKEDRTAPGMPLNNTDLANQKLAQAKRLQRELENEDPLQ